MVRLCFDDYRHGRDFRKRYLMEKDVESTRREWWRGGGCAETVMATPVGPDAGNTTLVFERPARGVATGAALRRYVVVNADGGETDILWGYSGGAEKGGQGDVLIPFPGRVARALSFRRSTRCNSNGTTRKARMPSTVRTKPPWTTQIDSAGRSPLRCSWMRRATARVPLFSRRAGGVRGAFRGLSPAHFQFRMWGEQLHRSGGFPSLVFTVGTPLIDGRSENSATGYLEFNEQLAPTGKVVDATGTGTIATIDVSARAGSTIATLGWNAVRMVWHGVPLRHPGNRTTIDVVMDGAFPRLSCTPATRLPMLLGVPWRSRPMTCATDAFNHPEWGLTRLLPDDTPVRGSISGWLRVPAHPVVPPVCVSTAPLRRLAGFDDAESYFIDLRVGRPVSSPANNPHR